MAFSAADLTEYQQAITALSSGAEEVQIGNRRWRKSSLKELRETYDWLEKKVTLTTKPSIQRVSFASATNQDDH